ncbi:MAG: putative DNA polymerase [Prokaryotic dsDNA virus sp.]|nr:MAG: putative DNA polymerase [Prokaryotic dsDNA virus sp.]|tara:strand:+ start:31681 stop:33945 length:2265 start_codon:yes stop_codon:yes gene_type:complete
MRADALGLFWQDMPKIKKEKEDEKFLLPAIRSWELNTYLPYLREALEFNVDLMSDDELIYAVNAKHPFVFDIESYKNYYLIAFEDVVTEKVIYFERIGEGAFNQPPEKLRWVLENAKVVGFNSNGYDMPIGTLSVNGFSVEDLKNATNAIIAEGWKPWQVLKKAKIKPLKSDHIDIMEVAPLFGSLKMYGGRAGVQKMQDLPFHPDVTLSDNQIAITRFYCINDLDNTKVLFKLLEKDLLLREELGAEYGLDLRSKSDAQIAEAVIGKELEKLLGHAPQRPSIEPGTAYRFYAPKFLQYQTPLMNGVLDMVKNTLFVVSEKGSIGLPPQLKDLKITIGDSVYKMGIGGLHSTEKSTKHEANDIFCIEEQDVTSYYPFIILNNELFPDHLGRAFLEVFRSIVFRRLEAKAAAAKYSELADETDDLELKAKYEQLAKDNKRTSDSLKIVINGTFGKLGSQYSIFYSPNLLIQTTLTGQLSLLLLIETMELNGIRVISANTDGVVLKYRKELTELKEQIVEWWQQVTNFELECSPYKLLASKDVNNYIGIGTNGKVKGKGLYADPGLKKNPAATICSEAVKNYLSDGTPIEETVRKCTDMQKFITVRNVNGGGVFCKYYVPENLRDLTLEQKRQHLKDTGWVNYYHDHMWVQQAWIDEGKEVDRMATNTDNAFNMSKYMPYYHEFLGKAVRWYYAKVPEHHRYRIMYANKGSTVPKSDGAHPLMEMDGVIPRNLDFDWYISEAERIMRDIGFKEFGK